MAVQAPCGHGPWIRLVASALRMWPVDPAWVCGPGSRTQLGLVDLAYDLSLGFGPGCRQPLVDMLAALPCERCCLRTLPAGSGLATCGPGIGLAKLAYGPTMGLWTWLLMGLASPCCGLACRSSCYLRMCLAPATASKLPEKLWISTRGLGKFRMWLAASGPGRSCKFDQAACLTAQ